MKKQRLLRTLFVVLTALALCPLSLWADPTGEGTAANPYLISSDEDFEWLRQAAPSADYDGKTVSVKMTADYCYQGEQISQLFVFDYGNWTLDLNGHSITDAATEPYQYGAYAAFQLGTDANQNPSLTIKDSSEDHSGAVNVSGMYAILVNAGSLTVEGGSFSAKGGGLAINESAGTVSLHGGYYNCIIGDGNSPQIEIDGYELLHVGSCTVTNGDILSGNYSVTNVRVICKEHQYTTIPAKAATDDDEAVLSHQRCSRCGVLAGMDGNYVRNLDELRVHSYNDNGFCTHTIHAVPVNQPAAHSQQSASYQLGNAGQLCWFLNFATASQCTGELTTDIVVNENVLETLNEGNTPAMKWRKIDYAFNNILDGKGHTISGIYAPGEEMAMVTANDGVIRNLGIIDSYFGDPSTTQNSSFACYNYGTITDCYSTATVEGSRECGGIAARSDEAITNCYYAGVINSNHISSSPICSFADENAEKPTDGVRNNYCALESIQSSMFYNSEGCMPCSADVFAKGYVAYYLQNNRAETVWGQQLSGENAESRPRLGGARVYATHAKCDGNLNDDNKFTNDATKAYRDEHNAMTVAGNPYSCTEDGSADFLYCYSCGKMYFTDGTLLPNQEETDAFIPAHHNFGNDHVCTACGTEEPVLQTSTNSVVLHAISGYFDVEDSSPKYFDMFYYKATYTGTAMVHVRDLSESPSGTFFVMYDKDVKQIIPAVLSGTEVNTNNRVFGFNVEKGKEYHICARTLDHDANASASIRIWYAECQHVTEQGEDAYVKGDVQPATCQTKAYQIPVCSICGYIDEPVFDEESELADHTDEDDDLMCDVCGSLTILEDPVKVTASNYEELGLTPDHIGSYAISNLGQLAGFAAIMGAPMTSAKQTQRLYAPKRTAARRAVEPGSATNRKFVLTADIEINKGLFDKNGQVVTTDKNGNFRSDLLAWNSPMFEGIEFDGNGHTISGLYQQQFQLPEGDQSMLGFCSLLSVGSEIKNLGITKSFIGVESDGDSFVGAIAAQNAGAITNCWSDATLSIIGSDNVCAGGLVGIMFSGSLTGSYYNGQIDCLTNSLPLSGLVGNVYTYDADVLIQDCHFSGKARITNQSSYNQFYGILAFAQITAHVTIDRCYADGEVRSFKNDGQQNADVLWSGIVGGINLVHSNACVTISNSYNALKVITTLSQCNAPCAGIASYINQYSDLENVSSIFNCFSYGDYSKFNAYEPIISQLNISSDYVMMSGNYYLGNSTSGSGTNEEQCITKEEFASGEVAFLMNQNYASVTESESAEGPWYQELGKDAYPVLKGDEYTLVYFDDTEQTYYNKEHRFEEYQLNDGDAYDLAIQYAVTDFTYTRPVAETQVDQWQALYVPFAIPVDALNDVDGQPKASIYRLLNIVENDTDDNGTIDEWMLKVVKLMPGETTQPNTPYVIKPLQEGDLTIQLTDAVLEPAQENEFWCASLDYKFTFTGTYKEKAISEDKEFFISTTGGLQYAAEPCTLKSQRWFMTIHDKETESLITPSSFNASENYLVKELRIVCESEDNATAVRGFSAEQGADATIYNLQGQRLNVARKGLNIINGKKVVLY